MTCQSSRTATETMLRGDHAPRESRDRLNRAKLTSYDKQEIGAWPTVSNVTKQKWTVQREF